MGNGGGAMANFSEMFSTRNGTTLGSSEHEQQAVLSQAVSSGSCLRSLDWKKGAKNIDNL